MQTQTINCICTLHMLATDHAHRPRAPEYIQSEYIRAHAYSAKRTLIRPSSRTLGGAHTCKRTTFSCMHMDRGVSACALQLCHLCRHLPVLTYPKSVVTEIKSGGDRDFFGH